MENEVEDIGGDGPRPPTTFLENAEWSDGDAKDTNDGEDWGDEGDWNDSGGHVQESELDEKESEEKQKRVCIGKFQMLDQRTIKFEVDHICDELVEELGVTKGQAIHILRVNKWNKDFAVNKWLDNSELAKTRAGVTHPRKHNEKRPHSTVTCMTYSGLSQDPKSSSSSAPHKRRKLKRTRNSSSSTTFLVDKCKKLVQNGCTLQNILKRFRKKQKTKDVMKAYQQAQGKLAEEALANEELSLCDQKRGRIPVSEATQLSCGHWRCNECWTSALESELAAGRESLMMKCSACIPNEKQKVKYCTERVPRELFVKFLGGKRTIERYDAWVHRNYIETRKDIQCCPRPGCPMSVRKLGLSDLAQCQCGHTFCFNCLEAPHAPVPCEQFQDFKSRSDGEYQQRLWFQMHTMKCPRCQVRIEKNRACLHMTCKCSFEWCWACRQEWSHVKHNHYNCPDYRKEKEGNEIERIQARAAWELRKYMWYEQQMEISRKDIAEAEKMFQDMECELKEMSPLEGQQYTFLKDVFKHYVQAKAVMIRLYIISFYFKGRSTVWICNQCQVRHRLSIEKCPTCKERRKKVNINEEKQNEKTKSLFEFQQKMMVEVTSRMADMLYGKGFAGWKCARCKFENEYNMSKEKLKCDNCEEAGVGENVRINLRAYLQQKVKILRVCETMNRFVNTIVEEIESGKYDGYILSEPDDSIQGWFCIKCKRMNSFDNTICKCSACQVHGELACLRCQPRA
mmetsp:Transcript_1624/g.2295  ORF Transcript_1624/g.2295 Transcript_1624/m.2295 type:complete len:738 (-) Transcript_1624:215-2428(-)|eukprot:CAMPEP_0167763984 /NCGR_PEP_ID=MMETSP0110_2-20121227/13740_1 /TAXON_ID=629695 /ORGANISM="Gymnochlora sp., Strain CCMP2014" /LENGTH=737 /DNA_ID=CAMNT_0007651257 /DNA_START=248 /DNA_END=2461 /DNA_ORIENTATION=-